MADKYEMKDMTGSLFKNEKPKFETSPPYNGRVKIEGKEYYIDAYINEKKDGGKYFGLKFKPVAEEKKNDIGSW